MKRTDLPEKFQQLLQRMPYVTVATVCPDGTPWNTPLVGNFDDELNLYWSSDTESQHSQNLARNTRAFVVVYDTSLPLGQGEALYLEVTVRCLQRRDEVEHAKLIYLDRFGEDGHEAFVGECPRRIYQATPARVWANTDGERNSHFVDVRQQLTGHVA